MAYVDPGSMTEIIDIYDLPPNSLPILVHDGIHARKLEVANTTQSPVSAQLGQNIAWPRLDGLSSSLVTTQFTLQYIAGIRSRGYIIHHHPDDGLVRYDIDRSVDIDGQRVQLTILAFKRADGSDPFDAELVTTLDVMTRDTASGDERGISDPAFTIIATGIPCRVAEGKATQKGKEVRTKTTVAIAYREVYLRPWFLDPAPNGSFVPYAVVNGITYNTQPLTHNHWLLIPSSTARNSNNEPIPGEQYDIVNIDNPGLMNHHLEVACEVVLP
jgi:hypothetical protein